MSSSIRSGGLVTVLTHSPDGYAGADLAVGREVYESPLLPGLAIRLSDVFLKEGSPLASTAEKYLKPEVIRQVARLDLRAKFIVEGFISGLHASPFHGFSVEFSEHRKYTAGDNISDVDWSVFAKTDRFYIKKYPGRDQPDRLPRDGPLGVDGLHLSPGADEVRVRRQPGRGAGLPDDPPAGPVGLIAFDQQVRQSLSAQEQADPARQHPLGPGGPEAGGGDGSIAKSLHQVASMIRHRSLIMLFSDLLGDSEPIYKALHRLRHAGA